MHQVGLRQVLCYLIGRVNPEAQAIFWSIIFWIGRCIDLSESVGSATQDSMAMPDLVGVKGRSLKIPERFKRRVVELAAAGDVFKSGHGVLRGRKLMGVLQRHKDVGEHSAKSGNKWIAPHTMKYLGMTRDVFALSAAKEPVYSVAWDATRLSGLETLCATMYMPSKALACWLPPQVLVSVLFCRAYARNSSNVVKFCVLKSTAAD